MVVYSVRVASIISVCSSTAATTPLVATTWTTFIPITTTSIAIHGPSNRRRPTQGLDLLLSEQSTEGMLPILGYNISYIYDIAYPLIAFMEKSQWKNQQTASDPPWYDIDCVIFLWGSRRYYNHGKLTVVAPVGENMAVLRSTHYAIYWGWLFRWKM